MGRQREAECILESNEIGRGELWSVTITMERYIMYVYAALLL